MCSKEIVVKNVSKVRPSSYHIPINSLVFAIAVSDQVYSHIEQNSQMINPSIPDVHTLELSARR
jgi:hypothetical protein